MPDRLERESTMRSVDLDGPVWFEEWPGPGERTFVLVHGLGGSHLSWRLVAPRLAARDRVLAVDLAGFGRSPRAGRSSSIFANQRLLSRFVREVAGGPVVVAGNSMGGVVGQLLAARDPDAVSALVLSSSVFPWARGGYPAPIVLGGFTMYRVPGLGGFAVRQRFSRVSAERTIRLGLRLTTRDPSGIPEKLVQEHIDLLREYQRDPDAAPAFLEGARSILRLLERRALGREILQRIRCPVLVIHGRRDRFVPASYAEAAWRAHPSWDLRLLPDVGHVPQLEAPDRWLAAVETWLGTMDEAQGGALARNGV